MSNDIAYVCLRKLATPNRETLLPEASKPLRRGGSVAIVSLIILCAPFAHADEKPLPTDYRLPLLSEMDLPTVQQFKNGPAVDWIILQDQKVIVVEPLPESRNSLSKLRKRREQLQARTGGTKEQQRQREKEIAGTFFVDLRLAETPREEYRVKTNHVHGIITFAELGDRKVKELRDAGELEDAAAIETLVIAKRDTTSIGAVGETFAPGEHPFDGHWKLKSAKTFTGTDYFAELLEEGIPPEAVLQSIYIKDRKLHSDGGDEELVVTKDGDRFRVTSSENEGYRYVVERFENVLLMDFFWVGEPPGTFEFWRVDPERDRILAALKTLYASVSQLQKGGRPSDEISKVNNEIVELNDALERLDRLPEIESLTLRALQARKKGDHTEAKSLETQARELRRKLDGNSSQRPSGVVDVQIFAQPAMTDTALLIRLPQLEDQARAIANRLRTTDPVMPLKEREAVQQDLADSVREAFETRWRIQESKLNRAAYDLNQLRTKHQRRKGLADQIIGRRIQALLDGNETAWLQTQKDAAQTQRNAPQATQAAGARSARPGLPKIVHDDTINPELRGLWNLKSITGSGIISHEQDIQVDISDSQYTLIRNYLNDSRQELWARTDSSKSPRQILFSYDGGQSIGQRSIYKVEGNTLTIATMGFDSNKVPIDFNGTGGRITTLERVVSLPNFETPEELIDFMVKVGGAQNGRTQFDQFIQLLTEQEQKRFAGAMLATVSMMEGIAGITMFADQMGGEVPPEIRQQITQLPNWSQLVPKHIRANPPTESKAMYDILRARYQPMGLGILSDSPIVTAATPPDEFSKQLRLASGILKDPVAFCQDVMNVLHAMDSTSTNTWTGTSSEDWNIAVTGNTATARKPPNSEIKGDTQTEFVEMARFGKTWKVTSMISDEMLRSLSQGPRVSQSNDD